MQTFPHEAKLSNRILKYEKEKPILLEIKQVYQTYRQNCESISPSEPGYLDKIIDYTNEYLAIFTDGRYSKIRNNSQSKIYPSILEEAMGFFFKGLITEQFIYGSSTIPIAMSFKAFNDILNLDCFEDCLTTEKTDADFVIGIPKPSPLKKRDIIFPIVVIENKRYADKTMRRIIEDTARRLKLFAPDCLYILVVDLLSGFFASNYNPRSSDVDQIFGLREGNEDGDDSLRRDVVHKLYQTVEDHINRIRRLPTLQERISRGYLMD